MLKPDIAPLQAGDASMWEFAFFWLWPVAWSAANRRLGRVAPADVEDVAIAAVREAAEMVRVGRVSSFERLKALVGVIATRRALDHLRRMQAERRRVSSTESIEGQEELASAAPGPVEQVEALDLAELLVGLAARLPDRQREVLLGFYFEGLKQEELAKKLGMPIGTVGVTLSRAREALRGELEKHPALLKELLERVR
ncbi:MAG TPA: sigma-70 family RNA polymerase sigma factor [Candidatus Paceibacterota bacterium]|nr:sigma-70 family RNA polymerase sigma factor [Verrucomicrobiota bacterium]HSA13053.1 sigma-70 family RNA polymerase sigma factor [Candidatus Paceibacterota bacterium]